jgi:hypothetical protein
MATCCPKCHGCLVLHTLDDTSHVIRAARCVNCGMIVEPTILAFQQLQAGGERFLKNRYRAPTSRGKYK